MGAGVCGTGSIGSYAEEKMKLKAILSLGAGIIFLALIGIVWCHEYAVSEFMFIIGLILCGIAYAKLSRGDETLEQKAERINKNVQILNDVFWGNQERR